MSLTCEPEQEPVAGANDVQGRSPYAVAIGKSAAIQESIGYATTCGSPPAVMFADSLRASLRLR